MIFRRLPYKTRLRLRRLAFIAASILVSVFILLALTEFGFRASADLIKVSLYRQTGKRLSAPSAILCVGDSFTQGIGAPGGYDWPAQLQALIDRQAGAGRWDVVNWGRAGNNSSMAEANVRRFFSEHPGKAKIVVFCAGVNNRYNFQYAPVLPPEVAGASRETRIAYLLRNARLYHFSRNTIKLIKRELHREQAQPNTDMLDLLNMRGEVEVAYLRDWIKTDLARLIEEAQAHDCRVALLNYWFTYPSVDRAYAAQQYSDTVMPIDVSKFGFDLPRRVLSWRFAQPDDDHPNQFGYARIAEMVFNSLRQRGWLSEGGG